jgi:tRNA-specific 2-thiouridylase
VLALEPVTGNVRVGAAEKLAVTEIGAIRVSWPNGVPLAGPVECVAQVRAHGGTAPAVAELVGDELQVHLREPLKGVAPGQAVALYRPDASGDLVLASATIATTA